MLSSNFNECILVWSEGTVTKCAMPVLSQKNLKIIYGNETDKQTS